jgi:signal transduction histidine kinase
MFQIKAETQNLQLRFSVRSQVPQSIKTDEKKLRVCLINLLGMVRLRSPTNAIKFTGEGGSIALRASMENEQQPGETEIIPNSNSAEKY